MLARTPPRTQTYVFFDFTYAEDRDGWRGKYPEDWAAGRGAVPARDSTTLAALGEWMHLHGRSITGAGPAEPDLAAAVGPGLPPGAVLTQRADRLYLHLFAWPFGHAHLRGIADRVRYAQLLHDGSELLTTCSDPDQKAWNTTPGGQPPGTLTLHLPTARPDVAVPVVELFLNPAEASPPR